MISASVSQAIQSTLQSSVLEQGICHRRRSPGLEPALLRFRKMYKFKESVVLISNLFVNDLHVSLPGRDSMHYVNMSPAFPCGQRGWKSPTFMGSDQRAAVRLPAVGLLQCKRTAILSGPWSAFQFCCSIGASGIRVMKAQQKEVTTTRWSHSEQAWLSPRSPNPVPQLHLSHSIAPGVWLGRSECCRFASQWDWWVFKTSILQHPWHVLSSLSFGMKVLFAQTHPSTAAKPMSGDLSVWPNVVPSTGTEIVLLSVTQPLSPKHTWGPSGRQGEEMHSTAAEQRHFSGWTSGFSLKRY